MQSGNLSDNFEFMDPSLLNPDFPFYFSSLDTFPEMPPSDLFNYSEFETIDSSNFLTKLSKTTQKTILNISLILFMKIFLASQSKKMMKFKIYIKKLPKLAHAQ